MNLSPRKNSLLPRLEALLERKWTARSLVAALLALVLALALLASSCSRPGAGAPTRRVVPLAKLPAAIRREASSSPAPPVARPKTTFSAQRALSHVVQLSSRIGPRPEGSSAERKAASYITKTLSSYGYRPSIQTVRLPYGKTSRNVIAVKPGATDARLVLGAHYDSKADSPGANDNASGAGVLLELARVLEDRPTQARVVFVFFGAEEMIDSNGDHHHYGSRQFVSHLSRGQRSEIAGMISVDMIGYGSTFKMRTMGEGPPQLANAMRKFAAANGVKIVPVPDTGRYGWSDQEAFERAGIPAAWIEWGEDPAYHSSRDTAGRLSKARLQTTGSLLEKLVTRLSRSNLERLKAANRN